MKMKLFIPAVFSGLKQNFVLGVDLLSKTYISFETTSESSPNVRTKTSVSSKMGVVM